MDQVIQLVLMIIVVILGIIVFIKQLLKRKAKPKKAVGIIISKNHSNADEFSASKGYMESKAIYSIKIKCDDNYKVFRVSESIYDLLETNQTISFEYNGDILYSYEET